MSLRYACDKRIGVVRQNHRLGPLARSQLPYTIHRSSHLGSMRPIVRERFWNLNERAEVKQPEETFDVFRDGEILTKPPRFENGLSADHQRRRREEQLMPENKSKFRIRYVGGRV